MKLSILILVILAFPMTGPSSAEKYSCRDAKAHLHVADNLMNLPEECRNQAVTTDDRKSGKVNYVPPAAQSPRASASFEEAVAEEEQQLKQRSLMAEKLLQQARILADSYELSVVSRKTALRKKNYGFRKTILSADQSIKNAKKEKRVLLNRLEETHLAAAQKAAILYQLSRIKN